MINYPFFSSPCCFAPLFATSLCPIFLKLLVSKDLDQKFELYSLLFLHFKIKHLIGVLDRVCCSSKFAQLLKARIKFKCI